MRRLTPAMLTMVMFGIVGLLVVAYVAKNLMARDTPAPGPTTRNLPMAIANIPSGTLITENHLGMGPFPLDRLDRDMLLVNRVIVGRIAKEEIPAAQPIRANQLYQPGEMPSLSERITAGMRAVTIEVASSGAMVDGLVKPGERVDVLFTYNASGDDDRFQGGLTMRLFEGVKIIAYNRNLQQTRVDRGGNRVTLELTEPQANIITLAKDRGDITLTYNPSGAGNGGLALSNSERVTLYEILGLQEEEPAPQPKMAEIFRGTGRDTLFFDDRGMRMDAGALDQQRRGFDYRRYMGQPGAGGAGGRGRPVLPPSTSPSANPSAQAPAPNDYGPNAAPQPVTTPQAVPQPPRLRRDPTATRMFPWNN